VRCQAIGAHKRTVSKGGTNMRWTKPKVKEICVGLEINGYFPPEY
jgi:coenzyme PQQ precursor peptide PqqA